MISLLAVLLLPGPLQTVTYHPGRVRGSAVRLTLTPTNEAARTDPDVISSVRLVIERRIAAAGVAATIRTGLGGRIIVDATNVSDPFTLELLLSGAGRLQLRVLDSLDRFRNAIPGLDHALLRSGVARRPHPHPVGGDLGTVFGRQLADGSKQPADTLPGELGELLLQGRVAGEYLVLPEEVARVDTLFHELMRLGAFPSDIDLAWGRSLTRSFGWYRPLFAVDSDTLLSDADVSRASARYDPLRDRWVLVLRVGFPHRQRVCEVTHRLQGDNLVVAIDLHIVGEPARLAGAMCSGSVELELAEARAVAAILSSGPLPVPLDVAMESVEPAAPRHFSFLVVVAVGVVLLSLYVALLTGFARKRTAT